jgi:anti-anti-sigma regulatory factor
MPGTCECERIGDAWVVRLRGHFLTEEEATLVRDSILQAADARCVVVNWSEVRFMNTMMIGAVIWCAREIMARGGTYRNCGLPKRIHYALRGIQKVFDWQYYDTEADALRSCADHVPGAPVPPEP